MRVNYFRAQPPGERPEAQKGVYIGHFRPVANAQVQGFASVLLDQRNQRIEALAASPVGVSQVHVLRLPKKVMGQPLHMPEYAANSWLRYDQDPHRNRRPPGPGHKQPMGSEATEAVEIGRF